ncbi:glycine betaine ABC transporter substrate-binding protein [Halorubellus salinus]|uniref:glycine betaine ABC transporter substrate-binding protein n=1 Tax=Halorubellus salinus TaxID=755309 RepID=UPI001D08A6C1|nr:glycine betaine ABC transporter substrate-binding protein [Halorubellus salinus]
MKAGAAGAAASTAGCTSLLGGGKAEVAVGGKQFTEQLVLSNISTQLLESKDFGVSAKYPVGGSVANYKAVKSGRVDHYWEYTGTAWKNFLNHTEEKIRDPEQLYENVDETFRQKFAVDWLQTANFNNTYVVTANPEWQQETGVKTLSGLAEYINGGNEVTWAVSQEYLNNPTSFGRLPEYYGWADGEDNVTWEKMAIGTINYKAVATGEVDLGVGFATNPNIEKFDLGTVEDDENWFTIYYPAPVVRQDVLTDELKQTLNQVPERLDTKTMQQLNARVSIDKQDPSQVAKNWLQSENLL